MGRILRFPDRLSRSRAREERASPEAEAEKMRSLSEMVHTRRTQLRLFCDDFMRLIDVFETRYADQPLPSGFKRLRTDAREFTRAMHAAHATAHMPLDMRALESSARELLSGAEEISHLFAAFVKEGHAEQLLHRGTSPVVHLSDGDHSERIRRMLTSISDLVSPFSLKE